MKLYLLSSLFYKTFFIAKYITFIITLLSHASLANVCNEDIRSVMSSSTEEFKDIIELAKIISFLRENKSHSTSSNEDITIYPIDVLLASMTRVVEINNNQVDVVKADLTTSTIFSSLKALKEGVLLFQLQSRVWEELDDPIKESLQISEQEGGYILTLYGRTETSFDSIISRNAIFDQSSLDLLLRAKLESNEYDRIDTPDLLLAMVQSSDLYFIQELFISQLTEEPGLFERWFGDRQRRINEVRSIIIDTINMTGLNYNSMLLLQRRSSHHFQLEKTPKTVPQTQEVEPVEIEVYLLNKFGFAKGAISRSMYQIENNKFDDLRVRIKRNIARNIYFGEINEIRSASKSDIDALVTESDIEGFLKNDRSFTDEEIELFMQIFLKRERSTQPETSNIVDTDERAISRMAQVPQQRQQLISVLSRMDRNDLEAFIKEIGFEVSNDFMAYLMDPQRVPQNIKHLFIRFIADVRSAGSVFNIRTSNNTHKFKKLPYFNRRNKRNQQNSHNYYSLHLNGWVLVLRKEDGIFTLDRIISHGTYDRYF